MKSSMVPGKLRIVDWLVALGIVLTCGSAWADPPPLGQVPVPEPPAAVLDQYVKDKDAAIRLGKALFWEMQAGSDGRTACASCHYRAGADPLNVRSRNQLHPGPNGIFDTTGSGPTSTLANTDFPFFQVSDPANARLGQFTITRNVDDIAGSQGISLAGFDGLVFGSAVEASTPISDTIFNVGGVNTRQVTGRNSPSVINAVFNFTNFWDGRANNIFNGVSPFGPLDQEAGVWVDNGTVLVKEKVAIPNGSLASQAVGPPLSEVEMSFRGRTFPWIGRKLINNGIIPLGLQTVHPNDSVLGPLALPFPQKGLGTTYGDMIQAAFQDRFWNSDKTVTLPEGTFTQKEANFSLFWGLAIQLYEATLVSDRTPFDQFLAGNQNALTLQQQEGFGSFAGECAACHAGSELSDAVVGSTLPNTNPAVFTNNTTHRLIQAAATLTDRGFFNIGVRPTVDDLSRGGNSELTNDLTGQTLPLAFSRLAQLRAQGLLPFPTPRLPANVAPTFPLGVNGTFKTSGMRNIALTAPYFHNGSARTLMEVVEFYLRGGNFANAEMSPLIAPTGGLRGADKQDAREELVAFMESLTDQRVADETAPFDHPELLIPSGDQADTMITLPATGGSAPAVPPLLTLNPVTSPTSQASQVIGGTTDGDATVAISINGQTPVFAIIAGTPIANWGFTATGLQVGTNTVAVTATNLTGGLATASATIIRVPVATLAAIPPGITRNTTATLTVGGVGVHTYQYRLDNGAFSADVPVATPISLTGLTEGIHTVTVLGKDVDGNQQLPASATSATWTVKTTPPVLTVNAPASPTNRGSQTLTGTVEEGIFPTVSSTGSFSLGSLTVSGASWSLPVSSLATGDNTVTLTAVDIAGNVTTASATITVVVPDGNLKGTGTADMTDALKALRIAVGVAEPSPEELLRGDVAPLLAGIPVPDGRIDIADVLLILRKVVGLPSF